MYERIISIMSPKGGITSILQLPLWAYYEADSFVGIVSNGASVGSNHWVDKSGNGRTTTSYTGGGGAAPIFRTNEINGQPALDATGSSQSIQLPAMSLTEGHYFMVKKCGSFVGGGDLFGTGTVSVYPWTDGLVYDGWGSTVRQANPSASAFTNLTSWHYVHGWSKTNDWGLGQNGTVKHTSSSNTVSFTSNPILFRNLATATWRGYIAAVYIFTRKLTAAENTFMLAYINALYGL